MGGMEGAMEGVSNNSSKEACAACGVAHHHIGRIPAILHTDQANTTRLDAFPWFLFGEWVCCCREVRACSIFQVPALHMWARMRSAVMRS